MEAVGKDLTKRLHFPSWIWLLHKVGSDFEAGMSEVGL